MIVSTDSHLLFMEGVYQCSAMHLHLGGCVFDFPEQLLKKGSGEGMGEVMLHTF